MRTLKAGALFFALVFGGCWALSADCSFLARGPDSRCPLGSSLDARDDDYRGALNHPALCRLLRARAEGRRRSGRARWLGRQRHIPAVTEARPQHPTTM